MAHAMWILLLPFGAAVLARAHWRSWRAWLAMAGSIIITFTVMMPTGHYFDDTAMFVGMVSVVGYLMTDFVYSYVR